MKNPSGRRMFSIKTGVLRILLIGMLVLLLLSGSVLAYMIGSYRARIDESNAEEVQKYSDKLRRAVQQLHSATGAVYSSDTIFQNRYTHQTEAERWSRVYSAQNLLKLQEQTGDEIDGMFLYYGDVKPAIYYMNNNITYRDQELLNTLGRADTSSSFAVNASVIDGTDGSYYYVSMEKPGAKVGGCLNIGRFIKADREAGASYGCLYDGTFHLLTGPDVDPGCLDSFPAHTVKYKTGGVVVYAQDVLSSRMTMVKIVPESFGLYFSTSHVVMFAAILLLLIYGFFLRRFAQREFSLPLEDMKDTLDQLQLGIWDIDFKAPNHIREIEDVRQTVNAMLKSIAQYKDQAYEEQMERQRTQLQYSQLQLAPHFYTNCMKNAYYMAAMGEYDSLERFLLCLSTHLRYLLQPDRMFVTLKEECAFVENYIELQRLLTQKEISCEIHVEAGMEKLEIPILALQTFVENSVKYARQGKADHLAISIKVVRLKTEDGERINITVTDNGVGYPEEVLAALNGSEPSSHEEVGIGVINLQKRCRFHYGSGANWGFLNMGGAVSELVLPVRRDEV